MGKRAFKGDRSRDTCYYCGCVCEVRHSEAVSDRLRRIISVCSNLRCGHRFVSFKEVVYSLSPTCLPTSELGHIKAFLPLSKHVSANADKALQIDPGPLFSKAADPPD